MRNRHKAVTFPVLVRCEAEKRDGHIALPNILPTGRRPVAVRVLPLESLTLFLTKRRAEFRKEYGSVPAHIEGELQALWHLVLAFRMRDQGNLGHLKAFVRWKAAQVVGKERRQWEKETGIKLGRSESELRGQKDTGDLLGAVLLPDMEAEQAYQLDKVRRDPVAALLRGLNEPLGSAYPVIWWNRKSGLVAPGLYCPDVPTGLFALLLCRLDLPDGWAFCERCEEPFPRIRRDQAYCSLRCGAAARMARSRAKKREPLTSTRKGFRS